MMTVHITCPDCGSAVNVYPDVASTQAQCDICQKMIPVTFTKNHEESVLKECPVCTRQDFYGQKDFNRKVGVLLFVIAAILSIWTYGISLIVLYLFDVFLFRKLNLVAVCYKCQTVFRRVSNMNEIHEFNHEMNDRIIYSDHDFKGKPLSH